ncbi:MAG: hypothetical protein JXB32_01060 [Deltaproteobacteria bacterium]|nr:hypothetical protein [Deltaproteobacteria bacterium]
MRPQHDSPEPPAVPAGSGRCPVALLAVLALVACSPSTTQPGPEDGDATDPDADDDARENPSDSRDTFEAEVSDDGEEASDASSDGVACDGAIWENWSELRPAGDGCEGILADPAPGMCTLLPYFIVADDGYVGFVPGEGYHEHGIDLMSVTCGTFARLETMDSCPQGALAMQYPWFGYTCDWRAEEAPDPPPGPGSWVYAVRLYNIETGERRQFHHVRFDPLAETAGHMRTIEIDWPWIATEDCRNGPGLCGIVLINAETGEERVVSELFNGKDEAVEIHGNYVVFDRLTTGFGWNPCIYDMRTGIAESIFMDTIDQWGTQVDGDWVVWVDQRNDPEGTAYYPRSPDLYGWEISTRTERPMAVAAGAQMQHFLKEGWLLWSDYRNDPTDPSGSWGSTNSDVYARRMPDGPEVRITTFPDTREWVIGLADEWVYVYRQTSDHGIADDSPPAQLLRCPLPR